MLAFLENRHEKEKLHSNIDSWGKAPLAMLGVGSDRKLFAL